MSRVARALVEKRAGLRYRLSQLQTPLLRAAFAHVGRGTVVVTPLMLTGVERISLGDGVIVRDDAWLATEGEATLSIGDGTYVGHRAHLHALAPVSVVRRCVLADNVMVTSADHDPSDRHGVHARGPVIVEDDVFLGRNVVVLGGVTVGRGATVAAGAVVTRDVPPGVTVAGVPARALASS